VHSRATENLINRDNVREKRSYCPVEKKERRETIENLLSDRIFYFVKYIVYLL
jgi:hypothetical protein